MKITYNWLKEYIDVPWDWRQLVDKLTMSGLETESVTDLAAGFQHMIVGQVVQCRPHPDADRLSICTVDIGTDTRDIVCGAPNVQAGQKVAVALEGATLAGGMQIRKTRIRGVASAGMICAEDELGLGVDHQGIMVLDDGLTPGTPLAPALGLEDVAIDFEVTPNRPDCLSVWGIAREVRALTGAELAWPRLAAPASGDPCHTGIGIDIQDSQGCPRYVARIVRGVRVGPSPEWLQRRLQAVGQRPINNVVDITNYVLQELGQPLHAFDLGRIGGGRIVVRRARAGEQLQTLDGVLRDLSSDILVIADAHQPVALAGIMGGASSEVTETTTDLLLESAYFDPSRVRRGRTALGVQTEAAMRFERGADWAMAPVALDRAAALITDLAGGRIAPSPIDVRSACPQPPQLTLRAERLNALLATQLQPADMARTLERLGCTVSLPAPLMQVTPPSYRPDLTREVDLIEEVGRIHGFDSIPASQSACGPWLAPPAPALAVERKLGERLLGLGFDEVVTNTVVEQAWLELTGETTAMRLANPPTETQSVMRSTLATSLLDVTRRNLNRRVERVFIYEIGTCFRTQTEAETPAEYRRLAALCCGPVTASTWQQDRREAGLLDLRGTLEDLFPDYAVRLTAAEHPLLRPGYSARVHLQGLECGWLGEVAPSVRSAFDIDRPVHIFELETDPLVRLHTRYAPGFKPLPRYPAVERDLAVVVDQDVECEVLMQQIRAASPELIESVELFDLYEGDQIPAGRKSLAFAVRLRSPDQTLEDKQADRVIDRILKRLETQLGARLR